ncbi:hypothetical protein LOTGIDRAFT_229629 [Lottia gigantea]|uniref:ZP domain-containing protein n=1 Tax=Lottia gigantea TaxID=225164 RepID=V3ZTB2_LOTGI|nr:hypothetical protein LOTGIDRAFT_229629 [Lottia gigantea]ESO84141.1 hypothetical protein LOTGIDRAFT_229629 [Lottia gigantea]
MWALQVICFVTVVVTTWAATPCCTDREYEADIGVIGSTFRKHNFNDLQGYSSMSYDSHGKMVVLSTHVVVNGTMHYSKVVFDYNAGYRSMAFDSHGKMEVFSTHAVVNGTMHYSKLILDYDAKREYAVIENHCTVYELDIPMRGPCIPDNATFLREAIYGYGSNTLYANTWEYIDPNSGAKTTTSVTRDTCIPLVVTQYKRKGAFTPALSATPCCIDREFEADLGVIGSNYGGRHFNAFEGVSSISTDTHAKMTSVDTHVLVNGSIFHTKIVLDYINHREYLVVNGDCNVYELHVPARDPCIPDNATHLRETIYGYGTNTLYADVWEYTNPYTGGQTRLSVTKECVPLVATRYNAHSPVAGGQPQDLVLIYSNFRVGIKSRHVFNIPKQCANKPVKGVSSISTDTHAKMTSVDTHILVNGSIFHTKIVLDYINRTNDNLFNKRLFVAIGAKP